MSIEVALDNIYLEPADTWAHTEYSLDYHKEYLAKRTGLAPDGAELLPRGPVPP